MNRSILIVICDFFVLSVLSLSTGVQPDNNGRTLSNVIIDKQGAAILIAELSEKHRALEQAMLQAEKTQKELNIKSGVLDKLGRDLESRSGELRQEQEKRGGLEKELRQSDKELYHTGKQLEQTMKEANVLKSSYMGALEQLGSVRAELIIIRQRLEEKAAAVEEREKELKLTERELQGKEKDLVQTVEKLSSERSSHQTVTMTLSERERELEQLRKKFESASEELSYARGRLGATETELDMTRKKLSATASRLVTTSTELGKTQEELNSMKSVLNNAVTDLSSTRGKLGKVESKLEGKTMELSKTEKKLEEAHSAIDNTVAELSHTRYKLSAAEEKLRNDVLNKYSAAAAKLSINMRERQLLLFGSNTEYNWHLPRVEIDGKTWMIGDFFNTFGMSGSPRLLNQVEDLSYHVSWNLAGEAKSRRLEGEILVLEEDPRVCLIPCPVSDGAIGIHTYSELKERGLQNLFLVKKDSFGKHIMDLGDRCSLDLAAGGTYLYIRNTGKPGSADRDALPGDTVMSKDGKFVGVVVDLVKSEMGRRETALCHVFPGPPAIASAHRIPMNEKNADGLHPRFSEGVNRIRELLKAADKK